MNSRREVYRCMSPATHTSEENFVQLFAANERHLRAFVRSVGLDWNAVDDVVQTVSLVMWRKFDQFDPDRPGSKFIDWAFMIARYEVLKYRRKKATDRLVFTVESAPLFARAAAGLDSRVSPSETDRLLYDLVVAGVDGVTADRRNQVGCVGFVEEVLQPGQPTLSPHGPVRVRPQRSAPSPFDARNDGHRLRHKLRAMHGPGSAREASQGGHAHEVSSPGRPIGGRHPNDFVVRSASSVTR